MIYWDDYDYDRRTKNSDLKRELGKVVTHLRSLNKAMGKVSRRTGDTINYLIYEHELRQTPKTDVFMTAVQTNALLLKYCEPLVLGKHEKTKRVSAVNLAAAMIAIWERVTGENFKANTKKSKVRNSHPLIKDLHEFQGRGPHFVHVMLQTIDPTITQSMVESSIKALTDRSRRKMAQKFKP